MTDVMALFEFYFFRYWRTILLLLYMNFCKKKIV